MLVVSRGPVFRLILGLVAAHALSHGRIDLTNLLIYVQHPQPGERDESASIAAVSRCSCHCKGGESCPSFLPKFDAISWAYMPCEACTYSV